MRLPLSALVLLLLVLPGCRQILSLPGDVIDQVYSLLTFWAAAPEALEDGALQDGDLMPIPLEVAVKAALRAEARGELRLLPVRPNGVEPATAPFPSAVLVVLPVLNGPLTPRLEARLRHHGLRLVRVGF